MTAGDIGRVELRLFRCTARVTRDIVILRYDVFAE